MLPRTTLQPGAVPEHVPWQRCGFRIRSHTWFRCAKPKQSWLGSHFCTYRRTCQVNANLSTSTLTHWRGKSDLTLAIQVIRKVVELSLTYPYFLLVLLAGLQAFCCSAECFRCTLKPEKGKALLLWQQRRDTAGSGSKMPTSPRIFNLPGNVTNEALLSSLCLQLPVLPPALSWCNH